MTDKPWQGRLNGRQVLRVMKEQARRHDNDTRHLTRAELNSELAAVARELYPAKFDTQGNRDLATAREPEGHKLAKAPQVVRACVEVDENRQEITKA